MSGYWSSLPRKIVVQYSQLRLRVEHIRSGCQLLIIIQIALYDHVCGSVIGNGLPYGTVLMHL